MQIIIMNKILTFTGLATILLIIGCTKEISYTNIKNNHNPQSDSVIQFLKREIPKEISKLDLTSITKISYHNQVIAFQIFEKSSDQKFIIIRKEVNTYVGNWVDLSGLSKDRNLRFSGKILLSNFDGQSKKELNIENNKVPRSEKSGKTILISSRSQSISRRDDYKLLPEIVIFMSDRNVYLNLSWLFDGYSYYNNYFTEIKNNESGGGGSTNSSQNNQDKEVIELPVFTGPKNPIKNLKEELKCFTINATSSYSISVRINQPRPNSSDKVNLAADYIVGHTYLSLEQVNIDGSKVSRNVGFYPESSVYPGSTSDVSVFGEDSNTPFAVSLNIAVTGTELNTVINTLLNQQSKPYELNNFNCVNSAGSALVSIGINLPLNSSGITNLFKGSSPGELGQDIRNLDLNSFISKNGNRMVSREMKDKNELKPSPKEGTCN